MKPEKQQLIDDLLGGPTEVRRRSTLAAGGCILCRRRQRRVRLQACAAVAVLALISVALSRLRPDPQPTSVLTSIPRPTPSEPPLKSLTDAELLSLFPETPVGLVTLDDGRQRLIFPRAEDEARFARRL